MFVKTGDNVEIITGDDKGKQGAVLKALPAENKVIVKGVHVVKKHSKPTNTQPQGGIIDVERPINVTNVKVVKGSAKKTTTAKKSTKSTDKKEDK
ncbi:50S ribosomal protein L24 [Companilactobacillus versmoldensis]|uniref:Large ribosomal subunit protein uL24 n=1 Tax=Companilactobacillus versmoldensis DSM 14857 = KCTC 3814 TaxID=1423815 RepID=A0A0R1SF10_9LACO|nr:50S ribosomal protein L24 [Companilactobacillus versmoldensis]KRL65988.1 50S ribosomal protein L24 [Companilactobacillus versmoldensis DSM 14857 = KCTC 3814]